MSVESFQWLMEHGLELGYKLENIGPASVDLELGSAKFYDCLPPIYKGFYQASLNGTSVIFEPGLFYLASTVEYIKVPPTHCALVNMRSSLARKGLGHKMAGFIDPGFEGQITLELETSIPLDVAIGERIVQLIYCRLTEETKKPYVGRYRGQTGPTEAYK